jgi:hypothetical protein
MCCGRHATGGSASLPGPRPAQVTFQYVGSTGLTVTRTPSGATYRFAGPGARVLVDARDRRALAAIPQLRLVG